MDYKIIDTEEAHVKDILDIYNYYVENSTATYYTHLLSMDEMRDILFFENPKYGSFTILNPQNEVIGYLILNQYNKKEGYSKTAEITIYIKSGFTQKGVGSLALEFLEDIAKKRDIHLLIAAATSKNTSSISLFKKFGYEQCAHFKEIGFKFGEILDDVFYQKILGE